MDIEILKTADESELATTESLTAKLSDAEASVDLLTEEVTGLKASIEARAEELAVELAEERAGVLAARIAAECGGEALDVTGAGDEGASEIASLSEDERWARYESIRKDKGDAAAHAFYEEHMEGRG